MSIIEKNTQYRINHKINTLMLCVLRPFFKKRVLENIIIFESHTNFDCNGGALYDYLIRNGYNEKYKIVWRIRDDCVVPDLPNNVHLIREDHLSLKRVFFFLKAKYFFSDNTMPKKPLENQISVYCTHGGCTIKNVKGLLNVREDVDYILSSSENYDPIMCENYSIPFPNEKMLHLGFPSNDLLFEDCRDELRRVTNGKYNKVILWLPTFRKNESGREDGGSNNQYGIPLLEKDEQLFEINNILRSKNILLIVKLHPGHDDRGHARLPILSNIVIIDPKEKRFADVDVYRLMACSDALISDYSSSAYSFILKDKPIAFVLSDIDAYKPGFIVQDSDRFLVGNRIYRFDDLKCFLSEVSDGIDRYSEERTELKKWLYEYIDGNACKRIVEYFNL